jgi:ADP-ribose pyrophosphatase
MSGPWEVLARRSVFSGGPVRDVAVETVRLPNGRVVDDYYRIELADYVLVCPELDDGTVWMLRQYRHGVRRVCLGFPGGAIEPGESPLDAARRELLEEVGCVATGWRPIAALATNGNQRCNVAHLFHAVGCRKIAEPVAPDMEQPQIVPLTVGELLSRPGVLEEIGLASHVALLLAVSHPRLPVNR